MRNVLLAVMVAVFAAAVALPAAADTLKIGAPQPMTGPDAPFGDKFKKAYDLAVEEINAAGGVNGTKIEVIIEDHQAKNPLAATVAEKLITQDKVLVLTGGRASGQAIEIASVAQRLKTPYLVDHPSADMITAKGFEWVFRNNPTGSIYPEAFNKFITEVPGRDAEVGGRGLRQHPVRQDHRQRGHGLPQVEERPDRERRGLSGEHAGLQADHDQGEGQQSRLPAADRGVDHRRHPDDPARQGDGCHAPRLCRLRRWLRRGGLRHRNSARWAKTSSRRPPGPATRTTRRPRPSTRSSTQRYEI